MRITKGKVPKNRPFVVHMGWASSMAEEGKRSECYAFKTQDERDAFLLGVEDGNGWESPSWDTEGPMRYSEEQGEWVSAKDYRAPRKKMGSGTDEARG